MVGYVEADMGRQIAVAYPQAYEKLLKRFPKIEQVPIPALMAAPASLMEDPLFTPRMRLIAEELRKLFSGEDGAKVSIVLFFAGKEKAMIRTTTDKSGRTEYGVGCLGPYRRFYPKKQLFRPVKPVVTWISFEELCFQTEDAKLVYAAVYVLLAKAIMRILDDVGAPS